MAEQVTGGCMCGAKRYVATIADDDAYLCHCRMCQRWSGNVSIALKDMAKADVVWETPPDYFASSPIARRGFCAACGTALTFEFPDSDHLDLTVGSFDDPSRFRPVRNYAVESWHTAWLDVRGLEAMRSDENSNVVDRWMKACGKLPD
ncbi:GFA family protein [Sphingomonas floccifaciens]|uniref:GFA family protein n=1 Tax=Sphingomonas floccifaciens TaxID=1844115 RepID=A0ABW4NGR4_9SPHN